MLVKNDTIKMTSPIDGFNQVGDTFKVVNVTENGNIIFSTGYGSSVMTFDEFEKHFERIEPVIDTKRIWTDWIQQGEFFYKTDNKKYVKVKKNGYQSKSSCSTNDEFSVESGVNLCLARIIIKQMLDNKNDSVA